MSAQRVQAPSPLHEGGAGVVYDFSETVVLVTGAARGMGKHAARHMIERGGGGRVVTVSSTSALVGIPNQAGYQASKHGVVGLTRTLALELAPHGVTVNTVCPTVVYTPMLDHLMELGQAYFQEVARLCGASTVFPGLDALDVRDVSEAVLWLASPAARYVTGIALPVDGGFTCK